LGRGTDGTVWQTKDGTAVKVFERELNYTNELECYRRLRARHINQIDGLAVPELVDYDDEMMIVEMTIVQLPYLLDFGKVYIDESPPYAGDKDTWSRHLEDMRDNFGTNYKRARRIVHLLKDFGIHYIDPKPANIRFEDDGDDDLWEEFLAGQKPK
jgi:hypothetical protein